MTFPTHDHRRLLVVYLFWLSCHIPLLLGGQSPIESIEKYGVQDGLSGRIITDMITDSRGLLWCATTSGLNLYDGYSFSKFLLSSETDFRINGNSISDIAELDNSRIFIRYRYNLEFVDAYSFRLGKTQKIMLDATTGVRGEVLDIGFQQMGSLFVLSSTKDSLYLFKLNSTGSFDLCFSIPIRDKSEVKDCKVYPGADGNIWINHTAQGLVKVNENGLLIHKYTLADFAADEKPLKYPGALEVMHQAKDGKVYFVFDTSPGVYILSPQEHLIKKSKALPSDRWYKNIWEDQSGNLFFGTRKVPTALEELFCLQPNGQVKNMDFLVTQDPLILCLLAADMEDYIFLGTYNGLYRVKFRNPDITNYLDTIPGYWGKTIKGITSDGKDQIFFAKETQWWYQLDMTTGLIDTLKIFNEDSAETAPVRNSTQLIYDNHHLWGTYLDTTVAKGFLVDMDLRNKRSTRYQYPQEIRSFMRGSDGHLWMVVGTNGEVGKLVYFDKSEKQFVEKLDFGDTDLRSYAIPTFLLEGKNGQFWIGTTSGLLNYDPVSKHHQTFTTPHKNGMGLNNDNIIYIGEYDDGLIYLGTFGGGINVLDPKTNTVKHWDVSDGLVNDDVCGMLPADGGNFWVSTFNGLSYWDRKNNAFRNYFIKDGLSHDEFNRFSFYKHHSGDYFFGNLNGLSSFKTEHLVKQEKTQPLCITRLAIYNSRRNELLTKNAGLGDLKQINLSPYDSYFELDFTLPEFDQPEKHQYFARLEGLDSDWNFLQSTPYVRYNTLEAGNYILHLKGSTSSGDLSSSSLQIEVNVKKVFYKTWGFWLLILVLVSALIYSYYQASLKRLVEVERLRTKIASDLHDEVGGILTRISMGSDILQEGIYSDKEQKEELKNIAAQSRAATSIMRDIIWSIDARQDKVRNLVDRMRDQLTELSSLADIASNMKTEGMLSDKVLEVDVRQNIYFIFKEAINNTVKHANATVIDVFLSNSKKEFVMRITDDGKNHNSNLKPVNDGQGLKNMKMRAKRLKGHLTINKQDGFEITLTCKPLW